MTNMTFRIIKAKHGDSLLILADGATVLIDGGPSGVYKRFLRDHLENLESVDEEPPVIDLMMISHIDADHIDGILDLTDELLEARDEERDPIVNIRKAWHNSFADVLAKSSEVGSASEVRSEAASVAGLFDEVDIPGFDPHESQLVLSSVAQGRQLRLDLKALNIEINRQFDDRLAILENANKPWRRGNLKISLIGPTTDEIEDLQKEWKKQLTRILKKEADLASAASSLDKSVSNLASLVCIAEAGGKTILLTGDARGDMILKWLEKRKKLAPGGMVKFDVVKLPHHGSNRNVNAEFFERVHADYYVACGDGKHGNPEPDTFDMLFAARPDFDYKVYLTYGPDELKAHKEFKKEGNDVKLDQVLKPAGRKAVFVHPKDGSTHLDITL